MDNKRYLEEIERVIQEGKFKDSWESLSNFTPPKWYVEAKFGIFIHWGIYSVPAFNNEWYSRNMYIQGSEEYKHHIATYGEHKDFGYKDFIPMFKAEKFDADEWAELFEKAGARYVVPVAEHHDGFQMYKSEISPFNAYEMGPKRDVLGELGTAFDKRGLVLGALLIEWSIGSLWDMARNLTAISRNPWYVEIFIGRLCLNPIIMTF